MNDATVKTFGWIREEFISSNINAIVGKKHTANHNGYIACYLKIGKKRFMG